MIFIKFKIESNHVQLPFPRTEMFNWIQSFIKVT